MKKIYNAPVARVHSLHTTKMMANSLNVYKNESDPTVNASESLTDEETEISTSLWDEQW